MSSRAFRISNPLPASLKSAFGAWKDLTEESADTEIQANARNVAKFSPPSSTRDKLLDPTRSFHHLSLPTQRYDPARPSAQASSKPNTYRASQSYPSSKPASSAQAASGLALLSRVSRTEAGRPRPLLELSAEASEDRLASSLPTLSLSSMILAPSRPLRNWAPSHSAVMSPSQQAPSAETPRLRAPHHSRASAAYLHTARQKVSSLGCPWRAAS